MKTIRRNNFETNSSSSHSISIAPGNLDQTIFPDEEGKIVLKGGQFGWGPYEIEDALTKANYCVVAFINDEGYLEMLKEVIIEHTKCEEVEIVADLDYNSKYWSCIDHQSSGTAQSVIYSKEDLKNLIFNSNSVIYIDHDNH
jgi:hypothetical protein